MSIAGSFARTGDATPSFVDHALASLAEKTVPGFRRWGCGAVDLGSCNDASLEHISLFGDKNDLTIAVWGRIDNRQILARELSSTYPLPDSDAGLLLGAYRQWGVDFLDRVVGDFCCAIWDGRQQRMLLARDFAGRRPLVYHETPDALRFAAEPCALLSLPGFPVEIDEDRLAEWFARLPRSHGSTFHKNISQVPPGHVLIADKNGSRLHRYWRPEEQPALHLHRDGEYAEALLAALEQAVSCRLPAEGPVTCALSAGLDSPSVAALAARQLARQGRSLTAFTAVPQAGFDAAGRYPERLCDEGPLASSVARMYPNIDHVLIQNNSAPLLAAIESGIRVSEGPHLGGNNVTWFDTMFAEAKNRNASAFRLDRRATPPSTTTACRCCRHSSPGDACWRWDGNCGNCTARALPVASWRCRPSERSCPRSCAKPSCAPLAKRAAAFMTSPASIPVSPAKAGSRNACMPLSWAVPAIPTAAMCSD